MVRVQHEYSDFWVQRVVDAPLVLASDVSEKGNCFCIWRCSGIYGRRYKTCMFNPQFWYVLIIMLNPVLNPCERKCLELNKALIDGFVWWPFRLLAKIQRVAAAPTGAARQWMLLNRRIHPKCLATLLGMGTDRIHAAANGRVDLRYKAFGEVPRRHPIEDISDDRRYIWRYIHPTSGQRHFSNLVNMF